MALQMHQEPAPGEKPRYTSKAEVAFHFRISIAKVNKMIREGELPKVKIGSRTLIPTPAVEAYEAKINGKAE